MTGGFLAQPEASLSGARPCSAALLQGAFAGSPPLVVVLPKFFHYIRLFMVLKFHSLFLDFKTSSLELLFSNYQGKQNFAFNISFGTFYTCYLIARINTSII